MIPCSFASQLRMFKPYTPEELPLMRMRHAFRSSQIASALAAALFLWPLFLNTGLVVGSLFGVGNPLFRTLPFLLFLGLVTGLLLLIWLAVDYFLNLMSGFMALVCLAITAWLAWVAYKSIGSVGQIEGDPTGGLLTTLTIAFSLSVSYLLLVHGVRTGLLAPDERRVLRRRAPGESFWRSFLRPLPIGYGHRTTWLRELSTALVLILARMLQGLSLVLLCFFFGAFFFTVSTFLRGLLGEAYLVLFRGAESTFGTGVFPPGALWTIAGLHLGAAVVVFVIVQLAIALKRQAQRLVRASFERLVHFDERSPILFLRHFRDDQVTLPPSRLYSRYWLAEPSPRRLDHELVERFSRIGPIVAIGRPGEEDLPFGAARLYLSDEEWRPRVLELAEQAAGIIVVVDESPGIEWEIKEMMADRFVEKTLFLASPKGSEQGLGSHSLLGPLITGDTDARGSSWILGAYRSGSGWKVLSPRKCVADDYVVCCQSFFRRETHASAAH